MNITKQASLEYIATGAIGSLVHSLATNPALPAKEKVDRAILGGLMAMGALAFYKHMNRDRTTDGRPDFEAIQTRRDFYRPRDM